MTWEQVPRKAGVVFALIIVSCIVLILVAFTVWALRVAFG